MSDLHNAKKYAVRRKRHSIWRNIVTCIAAVVVFCTTYALILPAITMEYSCGKEEHVHVDGCYKLTCGLEQTPGHFHDETCYDEEGKLICGQEEPQSHTHTEACYTPADPTVSKDPICGLEETPGHIHDAVTCYALPKVLSCGQEEQPAHTHDPAACYTQQTDLTCGQQESAGHAHTEACYTRSLVCGLEESGEHTHSDACYSSELTCGLPESAGHTHTDACYTTTSVLTCTQPETAGHTHTDACYTLGDIPELICTQKETPGHTHTDACYPAASQPQLICGKEEVEVHQHTDECYTLICTLEEHTHTNECQLKEEPTETTAPTDGETQPSEGETQPSEGETQPIDGETQPSDGIVVEDEVPADGVTLLGEGEEITPLAEKEPLPFNDYVVKDGAQKPVCTTVTYDSEQGKYETRIKFNFNLTGKDLKATDGNFYIDINDDKIIIPVDGQTYDIKNGDELTGHFWFVKDPATNKTRMVIEFLDEKVNALKDADLVDGFMAFKGTANRKNEDNEGNLNINISDNIDVYVPSGEIENDNKVISNFDLFVQKSVGEIHTTDPDMSAGENALGTATIPYTVNVISTKGTPGNIDLTDALQWTSGQPENCTIKKVTVKKAPVTMVNGTPVVGDPTEDQSITQPVPSSGDKNVNWSLNLPQLGENEAYVVTYEYEYSFKASDSVTVERATNTAHATSKLPGGRPEERVDGEDTKTVDKITPPGPNPELKKTGTENTGDKTIDWTVTFNEDHKTFGDGSDFTITDTMLSKANDGSINVTLGGKQLTLGKDYTIDKSDPAKCKLVLISQKESQDKIVITYKTSSDALNEWTKDGEVNTVENTASYTGHFGDITTTVTMEKEGGAVEKSVAGAATKDEVNKTLTIPWKVVITPASDGIPAGTEFTDTPENAFDQKIVDSSFQVFYADANGNPVTDTNGNPIPVENLSERTTEGTNTVKFKFEKDPFAADSGKPDDAKTVVVMYNTTTTGLPDYNKDFHNATDVGGKHDDAVYPYIYEWATVEKSGSISKKTDRTPNYLEIAWQATVKTNRNTITEITDTLSSDPSNAHHYTTVPDKLTVWYKENGVSKSVDLKAGTDADYTVTFKDAEGAEVKSEDLGKSKKAVSMEINFNQDGGYVLPGDDYSERSFVFTYNTQTDSVPDVRTEYPNTLAAYDKTVTVKVPYDPNKLEKSVGTHTEDREKGIVTIPWTVKVTSESGKIKGPITDSLAQLEGDGKEKAYHFFPANSDMLKLEIKTGDGVLIPSDSYKVDLTNPVTVDGSAASALGPNTQMVITFKDAPYEIPGGGTVLQLTYNTVADTIDKGSSKYLDNKVWAFDKEATAQDRIDPPPATTESKEAGEIQQEGSSLRIPWTVYIKRGGAPLTEIEDQVQVEDKKYANHYLDLNTIQLEYLDEKKESFGTSAPQPPTPKVEAYKETYGLGFTPNLGTKGTPAKYMKLLFENEGGAFANATADVQYLKLTYETVCPNFLAESSYSFKNGVRVPGSEGFAETSLSMMQVDKTVQDGNNWTKNPVTIPPATIPDGAEEPEETAYELNKWRIRTTVDQEGGVESLTVTDVLPKYVKLDNLTVAGSQNPGWIPQFDQTSFNPVDGSFSSSQPLWVTNITEMTATGSCKKNENGQYVVEVTLKPEEGKKIPNGYIFEVYLTPRVDKDSLPHNLQGKRFSLTNQATVSHEAASGVSNPSTQIWTDPRPDVATGTLKKGRYPLAGGVLNYVVTINEKGEDLEPNGSSFVLIDTLTYNGSEYVVTHDTKDPEGALKGYDIRLDTSSGKMVRFYKPDSQGRLEVDKAKGTIVYGVELDPSEWAVTVDTKTKVDGSTEKIIRARVPDNTPLLMLYTYMVEPRLVPVDANTDLLAFEYNISNEVYMYDHKDVDATETGQKVTWQQKDGGGETRTGNTFTIKKMDAANNADLLGGAEFIVEKYGYDKDPDSGTWTPVVRDSSNPDTKFVTNDKGALIINTAEEWMQDPVKVEEQKKDPDKKVDTLKYNTLYRLYEIAPPTGYILPDNPTVYYFYCSGPGEALPDRLTRGATDLSLGSNLFWLENTSSKAGIHLEKIWLDHRGNVIQGTANQDFRLIQYKSLTNPSASDANDPLLSTRKLNITVKGHTWQSDTKTVVYNTMKNTMMQLTITNTNPGLQSSDWATIKGDDAAVFNPAIPEIRRERVDNNGDGIIDTLIFTFPATKVEESTIRFNEDINNLDVTLKPLGRSAVVAASLKVAGEGQDLEKTGNTWTITLKPGEGYKWSSDGFDADPNREGVQPLPFVENIDGTTWYYTYVVEEINGSAAYTVTYSNTNEAGELVSMSSGTIQVTNTKLENPPVSLPNTGGIGTTVFTLAGLALTGGAGLGLCKTKAKRKRGPAEKE